MRDVLYIVFGSRTWVVKNFNFLKRISKKRRAIRSLCHEVLYMVKVASGIAVAASIATLNPNLNLPALPPEVRG